MSRTSEKFGTKARWRNVKRGREKGNLNEQPYGVAASRNSKVGRKTRRRKAAKASG